MGYYFPFLIMVLVLISGCSFVFWRADSESVQQKSQPAAKEAVADKLEFKPNELLINTDDQFVAVCGKTTMLVKKIYQDDLQLVFDAKFDGDIRELSKTEAIRVGDQLEITNNNGKYCRYRVAQITRQLVRLIKME